MHYYIDGYNLLFRIFHGDDQKLQREREKLIAYLSRQIELLELDVTIVFDAQHFESDEIRASYGLLEVVFTRLGQTADQFIYERLANSTTPERHVVVTSDRELARLSRYCHANAESVESFMQWLNSRYRNTLLREKKKRLLTRPQAHEKEAPTELQKKPTLPGGTAEESFNFYLEQFEKRLQQQPPEELGGKEKKGQRGKKKDKPPIKEEPPISEMERWLKIFEERYRKNQNNTD